MLEIALAHHSEKSECLMWEHAMTYQQVLWAINDAAEVAAESAVDAFGQELPSAEVAWEFINEQLYGSAEIERPAALPHFFTRQFKHDYCRHCTILLANVSPAA
jgi:hypothetical protein